MALSEDPDARARQLANLKPNARPAPPGNTHALRHGGRGRTGAGLPVGDAVREIFDALSAAAPVRDHDNELPAPDEAVVELAARALCRVRRVEAWVDQFGAMDEKTGDVKPALRYLEEATRTADRLLDKLGMNPTSRARLGVDAMRAQSLASMMAEPEPPVEGSAR